MKYTSLFVLLMGALSGCDQVAVEDDLDRLNIELDFGLFPENRENDLNDPYVAGTEVRFRVVGADETRGWTFVSEQPEVMEFVSFDDDEGVFAASGAGVAHIRLLNEDGDCEEEFDVEVAEAARISVVSNAILESGVGAAAGIDMSEETLRVIVGGEATFRTRYYDASGRELRGRNVIDARGMDAGTDMSVLNSFSSWLRLTPSEPGLSTVQLSIAGRDVTTLTVEGVDAESIAGLELQGDEAGALPGDWMMVRAVGITGDDHEVFGVEPRWTVSGTSIGTGDLYSYRFDPSQEHSVVATFDLEEGSVDSTRTLRGAPGSSRSSSSIGCSAAGDGAGVLAFALGALGLVFVRRRR